MPDFTDHALHRKVEGLARELNMLNVQVDQVGSGVGAVHAMTNEMQSDLAVLQRQFEAFVDENVRRLELQRALTEVGNLQDKIEINFGFQAEARRTAAGILMAFDEGLVYQENLSNITQEVYTKASRYWLSTAVVALAEWSLGDQAACAKAVEAAFRRNPSSTSLFFALVTRRQGRTEASLRWLKHYLASQDPRALTSDFATVLEAVSQGAFTTAGRDLVQGYLVTWRHVLDEEDTMITAQVGNWATEINAHVNGSNANRFPTLATVSPQWRALDTTLRGAQAHEPLIGKYTRLLSTESRVTSSLEDRVDDILDRLVSDLDPDEVPLQQQLRRMQSVVEHEGRVSEAAADADLAAQALEQTKDYLTVQTMSALRPAEIGVSPATQKVAIGACADWFQKAHDQHSRDYRATLPPDVQARFDSSHAVAAATFKLPTWTGSFNRPMAELEASLASHWDRHVDPWIESLRFNWKRALAAPIIVSVLILVVMGMLSPSVGFIVAAVVFGIWGWRIRSKHLAAEAAMLQARSVLGGAKTQSIHALRNANAELHDWQRDYVAADAHAKDVTELIAQFRTTQAAPDLVR